MKSPRPLPLLILLVFLAGCRTTDAPDPASVPAAPADTATDPAAPDAPESAPEPFGWVSYAADGQPDLAYRRDGLDGRFLRREAGRTETAQGNLPGRVLYPFQGTEAPRITGWNADPRNPLSLALTTPRELFVSRDGGRSWEAIDLSGAVKPSVYLTGAAVLGDRLMVGTSFSGIYESEDRGRTWRR